MNRLRRKTTPPLPDSAFFNIDDTYANTIDGTKFLFHDGLVRKKRVVLFATEQQLRILFSATHIMMDGTFSSCVPHFDQVFSIHCVQYGYSESNAFSDRLLNFSSSDFPCIIGLLPSRTAIVYKYVFNVLNAEAERLKIKFQPTHIMSDFEKSLIKAISSHVNYNYENKPVLLF